MSHCSLDNKPTRWLNAVWVPMWWNGAQLFGRLIFHEAVVGVPYGPIVARSAELVSKPSGHYATRYQGHADPEWEKLPLANRAASHGQAWEYGGAMWSLPNSMVVATTHYGQEWEPNMRWDETQGRWRESHAS